MSGFARADLLPRVASGVTMIGLALAADWAGGLWFAALLLVVAAAVAREWLRLVSRLRVGRQPALWWNLAGGLYIGLALFGLWQVRSAFAPALEWTFVLFAIVWGMDVGAYFAGRAIGGPKIAPAISPSKTWAGLIGGLVVALAAAAVVTRLGRDPELARLGLASLALLAAPMALLAQAGDFFESWMKRRAGLKDSGSLIPGHGGVFDRVDGLLPVACVFWLWAPLVVRA